ncbi:MAG: VWA domain-containing protein, partial [Candidatus Micrarchaeota archaeon]
MSRYLVKAIFLFSLLAGLATAGSYLIIMDASGSMDDYLDSGQTKMEAAKEAATEFVDASQGNEIAVMQFDTCDDDGDPMTGTIKVIEGFTTDKEDLRSAINSITPGGETPIAEAL